MFALIDDIDSLWQRNMSAITITKEYFPDADEEEILRILREETQAEIFTDSYPRDGVTMEQALRLQLARAASRERFSEVGYQAKGKDALTCIQDAAAEAEADPATNLGAKTIP